MLSKCGNFGETQNKNGASQAPSGIRDRRPPLSSKHTGLPSYISVVCTAVVANYITHHHKTAQSEAHQYRTYNISDHTTAKTKPARRLRNLTGTTVIHIGCMYSRWMNFIRSILQNHDIKQSLCFMLISTDTLVFYRQYPPTYQFAPDYPYPVPVHTATVAQPATSDQRQSPANADQAEYPRLQNTGACPAR